jgi:glycosyltransferase involved in cell wall biosynthesis
MRINKKTILLVTTTHLAKNPRLVKEIDVIHIEYNLVVVFFSLLPHYQAFDEKIIENYPEVDFRKINWIKKYYPCRFFYTFLQKLLIVIWKLSGKIIWVEQLFFPGFAYLKKKCIAIKADIIHAHNPGSWGVAVQIGKYKCIPSSFDIEDFHSGEYESNDPKKKILEAIEDKYYQQSNHLIAASPLIAEAYVKKYPSKKATVINNVFPKSQFFKRTSFNMEKPLELVWFSQMIGPDRGLKEIVEAINQLQFKVVLNLYGECKESYRQEIVQQLEKLHQVNFKGLLSNNELNNALSLYDIGIASEMGHTPNRDFCLTNKIFAYVQAGLSILASDTAAQVAFLKQYPETGNLYCRKKTSEITEVLTLLHHSRSLLYQQQEGSYQLGQTQLCWEKESVHLLTYFQQLFLTNEAGRPLNIAITVDPEIPVPPSLYGGIERIVYLLVEELCKRGHLVTLFAHPKSKTSARLISWQGKSSPSFFDTVQNSFKLWAHYKKDHYDVVHSFSRLAYLSPLLNKKVAKVMSYQREPTVSQVKKAKLLARLNSLQFTGCSNYISDQLKPFAPVTTVLNGIELSKYDFNITVKDDAPLVFLGRIERIKGTHLAIALAKRSGKKLIIAGNIPKAGLSYFESEIAPLLNEEILYIGAINDDQKNELLGKACALLMPILWDEPFGIVMIEAMACGTPVIGFDRGALREIVVHGKNGYVGNHIDDLLSAIQKISAIDRMFVRKYVEDHFSSSIIVDQYLEVYKKTMHLCRANKKEL